MDKFTVGQKARTVVDFQFLLAGATGTIKTCLQGSVYRVTFGNFTLLFRENELSAVEGEQ